MALDPQHHAQMEALQRRIGTQLAWECARAGWTGMEMLTIALAIAMDMLSGTIEGTTLAEQRGLLSRADATLWLTNLRQLHDELMAEATAGANDLFALALARHNPALLRELRAKHERVLETERTRHTVTEVEFERMWRGSKPEGPLS